MEISATYHGKDVSIVDIDTNGSSIYVSYIDSNQNLTVERSMLTGGSFQLAQNAKATSSGGVGGGSVFITDIVALSGNVGTKVYDASGVVLESCISDTDILRVYVFATIGYSSYKPTITVNGSTTTLSGNADHTWSGYADIVLTGSTVTATHIDGATDSCTVTIQTAPEVVSATFSGGYPGSQTELKSGDTFLLDVVSDITMTGIEVSDYGALTSYTTEFSGTTTKQITVTIADRGTTLQTLSGKIRLKDINGAYGSYYDTISGGSVDGVNVLKVNNLYPTLTFGTITYPANQGAIKDSETATIATTIANTDSIIFSSPNSEVSVTNPTTQEATKTVTRIAGTYNIATTNFRGVATRNANGSTRTTNGVIKIAHTACTITVTTPAARLRSGGNFGTSAQNYTVTISSNQQLYQAPTITAPSGTFQGAAFIGGPSSWTRTLQIHDDNTKGIQTWTELVAVNLAGKQTTTISTGTTYTIGGFISRTLTVTAWPNRETAIGTSVVDTAKLLTYNNSKGANYTVTFQASIDNAVDKYTITNPTTVYNATGNLLYNCDQTNAVANGSGTATFTIEELV